MLETRPTSTEPWATDLEQAVSELSRNKDRWLRLPIARKIEYARSLLAGTVRTAAGQVQAACEAKGVPFDSPLAGEDWIGGPYIVARHLRLLIESLDDLRKHGRIRIDPSRVRSGNDGRAVVDVFPLSTYDRLLYSGFTAEVWMQPEITPANLYNHMGGVYKTENPEPGVALVLGAGNVASIAPLDVVHKLFFEGHVAILKLNPVNDYLGPFFEDAFAEMIRDGFVRIVTGAADAGSFLCHHPDIDEVHITGSARTHDLIVWGASDEAARRKAAGTPLLTKPITSELGNVSPMVILPGRWNSTELRFQAENLATQITQNCGFNCNATKVIVTHQDWDQREELLDELRGILGRLPDRPAYYPGAADRHARFTAAHPGAELLGEPRSGALAPALIAGLDPSIDHLAFQEESFCTVTCETGLPGNDAADFLGAAVDFCNDRLYGTLNAGLIADPRSRRELGPEIDRAIAGLRYGAVGINQWPAMAYAFGSTTWGAFPGHTLTDIQSGIGTVHNTFFFNRPEKSVVEGPFRVFPKPPWFVSHKNSHGVGRRLVDFEASPGATKIPGIVLAAMRG
ncbi:MAG: aldehyde dehydrogenase family protein [bacterium]|nr:aldehyde dehydrogenase family protein [bacterium]